MLRNESGVRAPGGLRGGLVAAFLEVMPNSQTEPECGRERLWRIIFLSDTKAGHIFDVVLLCIICLSTLTVMLDSVDELREAHGTLFLTLEWGFTGLFTIEYLVRLGVVRQRW